jgi:DNA-binding transcriptional LysR family regulator
MDVTTARTFLAAVTTGSFAAAASRVHASPSAVTERIKQLEHMLGVRLFDRDKRGCRLTSAGRAFVPSAEHFVRAWDQGCARVALPPSFSHLIRLGGQHALWPTLLIPWLQRIRVARPEIAVRAIAAAPSHLNRELEEDELDIAFLYEPVLRTGIRIEQIFADRLVLLTSRPDTDWRTNYARLDWGESANLEINARLGDLPNPGLDLGLGVLSLDWLIASGASGYAPERLALSKITERKLFIVEDSQSIEYSPFVCWRENISHSLVSDMVDSAKNQMRSI